MIHDGVKYNARSISPNRIKISSNSNNYYVFVEYLNTEPLSAFIDREQVWSDFELNNKIQDKVLCNFIFQMAEAHLRKHVIGIA